MAEKQLIKINGYGLRCIHFHKKDLQAYYINLDKLRNPTLGILLYNSNWTEIVISAHVLATIDKKQIIHDISKQLDQILLDNAQDSDNESSDFS